jgi:DnaB helicase-like protein/AAA domain-containing protein
MATVAFQRSQPLSNELLKKLPSNLDAERNILGAVLIDNAANNAAMKTARETLVPEDFFVEQNRRIFRNMLFLDDAQQPIEAVSIVENLTQNRELEAAGGAEYIASLMDGMPRLSNVAYYVKIVKEKSRLRQIIHHTHKVQTDAIEGYTSPDDLSNQLETFSKQSTDRTNPAVVVSFRDLLTMEMPALEYAIEPLLTVGGTGEIWAWRGTGKSFLTTEIATQMAIGCPTLFGNVGGAGGNWPISRAYPVLYVYGEMHGSEIQKRAQQIARGHGTDLPGPKSFGVMCKDFQKRWRPKINSPRDRKIIEERLFGGGYEVLILDNLSTLWPTSQEGEGERTATLTEWFLDLNQRHISVIYLHHAGKGGDQRGGSEKEDMLDFVLKLKRPPNYKQEEQLRVEVSIEKIRGESKHPRWLVPFEISLTTDRGAALWLTRPSRHAQVQACFEHFGNGMKPGGDLAMELGVSRATTYRYHKKYQTNSNPQYWIDLDDL